MRAGVLLVLPSLIYGAVAYYGVSVVQYTPIRKPQNTPKAIIEDNLREFRRIAAHFQLKNTDVAVFPEYSLTTLEPQTKIPDHLEPYALHLPTVNETALLCNKTGDRLIAMMSCLAADKHTTTIMNVLERDRDGKTYYSTTVAFDAKGHLVAKYRKVNLYKEKHISAGTEAVHFKIGTAGPLGLLTTSDILFKQPAAELFEAGVKDILLSMALPSTIPYLHAQSLLEGFSTSNRVNVLAANLNLPDQHIGGGGFYFCNVHHSSGPSDAPSNTTFTQVTPVYPCDRTKIKIYRITRSALSFIPPLENLSNYTMESLSPETRVTNKKLCTNDMRSCCTFDILLKDPTVPAEDYYRLSIFRGVQDLGYKTTLGVQNCGLVFYPAQVTSQEIEAIKKVTFLKVTITAVYPKSDNAHYQPSTLTYYDENTNYAFNQTDSDTSTRITIEFLEPHSSLLTFGIFGRLYNCDGDPQGACSKASLPYSYLPLYLACSMFTKLLRDWVLL